ncbi:hypothetical protein LXL04_028271 [Taraxacum kok-saghyz]
MGSRGHGPPPPPYGGRSTQPPGMMRHGSYSLSHTIDPHNHHHHDHRDNMPVSQSQSQSSELERLAGDNKRLATTHVALRQDLAATQQEIQKLRAHIGSIQTESDIQVRMLLDKIAKMEVHIRAGENVKTDLQKAHTEARALVANRNELISQIEQTTKEFEKVHADVDKLPEMQGELDGLRLEHHKLRSAFEHEKRKNTEKVTQMEVMERDLVRVEREVERLRAEVLNADKMPHGNVYGGTHMNPELHPPPPHMHAGGYGMNPYGGVHVGPQWTVTYGGAHPAPGGNPQWGRPPFDNSYPRQ